LAHWLDSDTEIAEIVGRVDQIDRFDIIGKS